MCQEGPALCSPNFAKMLAKKLQSPTCSQENLSHTPRVFQAGWNEHRVTEEQLVALPEAMHQKLQQHLPRIKHVSAGKQGGAEICNGRGNRLHLLRQWTKSCNNILSTNAPVPPSVLCGSQKFPHLNRAPSFSQLCATESENFVMLWCTHHRMRALTLSTCLR